MDTEQPLSLGREGRASLIGDKAGCPPITRSAYRSERAFHGVAVKGAVARNSVQGKPVLRARPILGKSARISSCAVFSACPYRLIDCPQSAPRIWRESHPVQSKNRSRPIAQQHLHFKQMFQGAPIKRRNWKTAGIFPTIADHGPVGGGSSGPNRSHADSGKVPGHPG